MSEDIMAKIFDPFFTTKSVDKGTCLGLATVYGIIKQSNGCICVHSELEKGTTFFIYLPCIKEKEKTSANKEKAFPVPRGNETILVVEDEDSVRSMATRLLKKLGYEVIESASSQDAYFLCQNLEEPVDLVITDLIMPYMNGDEFAEKLRTIWPAVKVLYMSGYAPGVLANQTAIRPDVPYLQKPFRLVTMGTKVRELLDA
jgi:CheY-like chemotaxis protein